MSAIWTLKHDKDYDYIYPSPQHMHTPMLNILVWPLHPTTTDVYALKSENHSISPSNGVWNHRLTKLNLVKIKLFQNHGPK